MTPSFQHPNSTSALKSRDTQQKIANALLRFFKSALTALRPELEQHQDNIRATLRPIHNHNSQLTVSIETTFPAEEHRFALTFSTRHHQLRCNIQPMPDSSAIASTPTLMTSLLTRSQQQFPANIKSHSEMSLLFDTNLTAWQLAEEDNQERHQHVTQPTYKNSTATTHRRENAATAITPLAPKWLPTDPNTLSSMHDAQLFRWLIDEGQAINLAHTKKNLAKWICLCCRTTSLNTTRSQIYHALENTAPPAQHLIPPLLQRAWQTPVAAPLTTHALNRNKEQVALIADLSLSHLTPAQSATALADTLSPDQQQLLRQADLPGTSGHDSELPLHAISVKESVSFLLQLQPKRQSDYLSSPYRLLDVLALLRAAITSDDQDLASMAQDTAQLQNANQTSLISEHLRLTLSQLTTPHREDAGSGEGESKDEQKNTAEEDTLASRLTPLFHGLLILLFDTEKPSLIKQPALQSAFCRIRDSVIDFQQHFVQLSAQAAIDLINRGTAIEPCFAETIMSSLITPGLLPAELEQLKRAANGSTVYTRPTHPAAATTQQPRLLFMPQIRRTPSLSSVARLLQCIEEATPRPCPGHQAHR